MTTPLRNGLLLGLLLVFSVLQAVGQCVPDSTIPSTPGIYPDPLVPAQGCEFYDEVITFSFQRDTTTVFAGQTITVDFISFRVDSIVGLPAGLSWECNLMPDCNYVVHPDSSQNDTVGCIRLFGTPTAPATYSISVVGTATVDLFGNPNANPFTFDEFFVVTPCAFEGDCYSLNLSSNCEPSVLEITNNIPSNGKEGFTYDWSLTGPGGFSYQTSDENPFDQVLGNGGDYIMNFDLEIDTVGFILNGASIEAVDCDDLLDDPDLYWIIIDPSGTEIVNTSSSIISNATLPVSMGLNNLSLDTGQYEIQVWDNDAIGGDDGCATGANNSGASLFFTIPPAQTGPITYTSGGLQIQLVIDNPVQNISCSDTIHVDSLPALPSFSVGGVSLADVDSTFFCDQSSIILESNSTDSLQWFRDGVVIPGAFGDTLLVSQTGLYSVDAIDRVTFCRISSPSIYVDSVFVGAPALDFDAGTETYTIQNPQPGITYTWFEQNTGEVATGTEYKPPINGIYFATATDTLTGCESQASEPESFVSGINSYQFLKDARVYPNPSNGSFTLSAILEKPMSPRVVVSDLSGKQVWATQLSRLSGAIETPIQIEGVSTGTYLLTVYADGQRTPILISIE